MLQNIFIGLAWFYWHINRPFVGAFTEALFGFGEGGLKVNGRVIVRKMTRYMHELQPQVFIRLVATVALLPLYGPPSFPRSAFWRALVKLWFGVKSFFGHWHFFMSSHAAGTRPVVPISRIRRKPTIGSCSRPCARRRARLRASPPASGLIA